MKFKILTSLLILLPLVIGCNNQGLSGLYKVKGKVTLQGQPIGNVSISLKPIENDPEKRPASGTSREDGTFVITTLKPGDGAYPAKYKVLLGRVEIKSIGGNTIGRDTIPKKYRDPNTTPIEYEVKAGKNPDLIIDIDEPLEKPVWPNAGKNDYK
ncbi:MAG: carboxypeptidase-like regulatory domain-containing protein [Planctomycetaceae bacterium]|jgi:hypothetical protein|nr:carboxypeptidase-like regulatory domain-containing protein [Planctomycetaceae bacterium]